MTARKTETVPCLTAIYPPFYFFEGPSIRKVGGFYVLSYAKTDDLPSNGSLAEIGYAYSDNPYGDPALGSPWQYGGVIVDNRGEVIRDPYSGGTIFTYKGGNDQATALLEKINANGEFYVGINIQPPLPTEPPPSPS